MDHAPGEAHPQPSGLAVLLHDRRLLIFTAAMVTFHLANAAMLPLVGQVLALQNKDVGTALMATCIVAAQVVMVPMAYLAGAKADSWGRKPIFLVAFAVLMARGFLYTLSDNPYWLVGVQVLDGVGAGIFGALFPLVVQDLTHGTGRFNVSLGAVTTSVGCRRCAFQHRRGVDRGGRQLRRRVQLTGRACRCGLGALLDCHARNRRKRRDASEKVVRDASPKWGRRG